MTLAVSFYEEMGAGGMARAREVYPSHSAYAAEFSKSGDLLLIGTFADAAADGSMAIFRSRDAAERFIASDPFVVEGVVVGWRILDWNGEAPVTSSS